MSIKLRESSLPGVVIIEPVIFNDPRGFFMETYHKKKYAEGGVDCVFVQDNYSYSEKGTLRGLHYQLRNPQAKLVQVITGEVYDVVVDIRRGSPTFGRWDGILLSSKNKRQLFIPEGFAHGFCVLSETADFLYKCTDFYASGDDYGVLWSDPSIGIDWPIEKPMLSEKDAKNPPLKDITNTNLPVYRP